MAATRPAAHPPNRLARETSPYLLQHAHNPVDWFPWGPEAFEEARRRDVPIFLSVGYSTCYWCHVMERESFENEQIGRLMSELFVCVKVDREERPDVDDIYMAAVQAFTGRGGWPMSVFLEPRTLKPFWAGTYFPPEPRYAGMPGFPQVLRGISEAWKGQREEVERQAEELAEAVRERTVTPAEPVRLTEKHATRAVTQLLRMHDRVHGGFGPAPKFPQPVYLELLLATRRVAGDEDTRGAIDAAVVRTLDAMALGGIFDQVGGGFHRYSVDEKWLVPHFEKMLYDNAQLAGLYARAARLYTDPFYARVASRILGYVSAEMTGPEGAFLSAQDAEVDAREGKNYLWQGWELEAALVPGDAEWAVRIYGLDRGPNFRDPHHPDEPPANVLFLADRPAALARGQGITEAEFIERLDRINTQLLAVRSARPQPGTDDKVLAGWNGLMIAAAAQAAVALTGEGAPRAAGAEPVQGSNDRHGRLIAARAAAEFVLARMRDEQGGLYRVFRDGRAKTPAFLEDYAFMAQGLIELHRAETDAREPTRWLTEAIRFVELATERFGDGRGGFFDTRDDQPDLFVRTRSVYDGAVPSGVSAMLNALISLYELTHRAEYRDRALACLASVSGFVAQAPLGAANSTIALLRLLTLAPASVREAFAAATETPGSPEAASEEEDPVQILAVTDRVEVAPGEPGGLLLRVQIAEGYHLNAANPGQSAAAQGLIPFAVRVVNGSGVAVYADYPPGESYGEGGEIRVYRGTFDLPVVVERTGDWSGRPLLAITYQACTDTACLRPRTVELDVAIDRK